MLLVFRVKVIEGQQRLFPRHDVGLRVFGLVHQGLELIKTWAPTAGAQGLCVKLQHLIIIIVEQQAVGRIVPRTGEYRNYPFF